jgi:Domain of unknown function (DUF4259)
MEESMGTWAIDAFGNDTANDWAYELIECKDLSLIEETLSKVLDESDDYLEAPDAEEAIAAIEVLARLQGNWGERNAYTEKTDKWIEAIKIKPDSVMIGKAQEALIRILSPNSELYELWEEVEKEEFEAWKSSIEILKRRIIV